MKKGLLLLWIAIFAIYRPTFGQDVPQVLSLQDCIEIAIENNLSIKRGELNLESSKINLLQSRASQLPNANANANSGFNWGRSINPTTNQFITQQFAFSGFNASSNVVLFNGFQLTNTVRQGNVNVESAGFDLEQAKNNVSLNITTFYLNVIFNRELLENAKFQVQSTQEQLERTKKLVAIGSLARTNELDLVAQFASNEVTLINAQNSLDLALLNLKQAMLIPSNSKIDIIVPVLEFEEITIIATTPESIYGIAEQNQPEIKSADLGVKSAILGVRIAGGSAMPTLALGGSLNSNYSNAFKRFNPDGTVNLVSTGAVTASGEDVLAPSPGGSFDVISFDEQMRQNLSRNLGLSISVPIFNGLRNHSNIQRSKITLQQAEITSIERRNTLRQQIETAYNDATAAAKTFNASKKQVEALEESYRAIQNQYNLGAANFTEYQVTNNNLFRAKSDLVRAKYDYIFRLKILDFYQGKPLNIE